MRMTLRHYVSALDGRAADVQESPFLYGACWPGEWLWVDSNGTDGKPIFHRHVSLSSLSKICNHFREIAAWSRKSLTMIKVFWKKTPEGQIFKKKFRKDSPRHGITYCVQISWNLADWKSAKSCVVYLTKNKTSARSPALASARIAPKIGQGQLQTIYSEFPKFHPNLFTSERVNIVEKVFPILGEASSPSNQSLLDFFSLFDSRLMLTLLYDSLNLVVSAFSSGCWGRGMV